MRIVLTFARDRRVADRPSPGRSAAALVLVAAVVLDLALGTEASLEVTLVFCPFVASALLPVRDTVVAATAAASGAFILGVPAGTLGTSPHLVRTAAVAVGGVLAVRLASERTARERKLAVVTSVAEAAQQAILGPIPPRLGSAALTARYVSASAEARVGGDLFEALETPHGVRLVVGDVRGKGLDAVRLAALLLGEFRSRAMSEPDLRAIAASLDAVAARVGNDEDFATGVVGQLDGDDLLLVRCGHPLPLRRDREGKVTEIEVAGTLPFGLGGMQESLSRVTDLEGSAVLFYSDGATETRDECGRDFDLMRSFADAAGAGAQVLDHILEQLNEHAVGEIDDDVVLVLAEFDP